MKKIFATTILATLVATSAIADDKSKATADPKKQEMMKQWKEYATPGAAHKIFGDAIGNWTYTSKYWEAANAKPEETTGTSKITTILGGRFMQNDVKGKAMGMPFEGMGLTGYDNLKQKYETVWLDTMGTGMMHGTATYDPATKTLTDVGTYSHPTMANKTLDYRSEWKMIDKNNMSYMMYGPGLDGSKEFKQMEMMLKRKTSLSENE